MKESTKLSLVASDLKIITILEPSWMLQDDMPQDHPGRRGNAASHSIDLWLWGLQGMQNLILGPVLNIQQSSELETSFWDWLASTKAMDTQLAWSLLESDCLCTKSYLITWDLLLWEILHSYLFPTIRNLAGLGRKWPTDSSHSDLQPIFWFQKPCLCSGTEETRQAEATQLEQCAGLRGTRRALLLAALSARALVGFTCCKTCKWREVMTYWDSRELNLRR